MNEFFSPLARRKPVEFQSNFTDVDLGLCGFGQIFTFDFVVSLGLGDCIHSCIEMVYRKRTRHGQLVSDVTRELQGLVGKDKIFTLWKKRKGEFGHNKSNLRIWKYTVVPPDLPGLVIDSELWWLLKRLKEYDHNVWKTIMEYADINYRLLFAEKYKDVMKQIEEMSYTINLRVSPPFKRYAYYHVHHCYQAMIFFDSQGKEVYNPAFNMWSKATMMLRHQGNGIILSDREIRARIGHINKEGLFTWNGVEWKKAKEMIFLTSQWKEAEWNKFFEKNQKEKIDQMYDYITNKYEEVDI